MIRLTAVLVATSVALILTACGPSEPSAEEIEAGLTISRQAAEIVELREALEEAASRIESANSDISTVKLFESGSCAELRLATAILDEIDEINVPDGR